MKISPPVCPGGGKCTAGLCTDRYYYKVQCHFAERTLDLVCCCLVKQKRHPVTYSQQHV